MKKFCSLLSLLLVLAMCASVAGVCAEGDTSVAADSALKSYPADINVGNAWGTAPWAPVARAWDNDWNVAGNGNYIGSDNGYNYNATSCNLNAPWGFVNYVGDTLFIKRNDKTPSITNGAFFYKYGSRDLLLSVGEGNPVISVALEFTAPESGFVQITDDKGKISSSSDGNAGDGIEVYIQKGKTEYIMQKHELNKTNGADYTFNPIGAYVEKGEKLYFAVHGAGNYVQNSKHFVKWNPVVTYTDVAPACSDLSYADGSVSFTTDKQTVAKEDLELYVKGDEVHPLQITEVSAAEGESGKYTASIAAEDLAKLLPHTTICLKIHNSVTKTVGENNTEKTVDLCSAAAETVIPGRQVRFMASDYLMNSGNQYWRPYVSNWDNYDYSEVTNLINNTAEFETGYLQNQGKIKDTSVYCVPVKDETYSTTDSSYVGNHIMHVKGDGIFGVKLSKGFIAPYTGRVRLEQYNMLDGSNVIFADTAKSENNDGLRIDITKQAKGKKIGAENPPETVFDRTILNSNNAAKLAFEPVEIYVAKGDIIRFDVINSNYVGKWQSWVHWNPVVTYVDAPTADAEFMNGETAITDAADLKNCTSVKITAARPLISGDTIHAVPIAAFYNAAGALEKVVLGNDLALNSAAAKDITIAVPELSANVVSAKVMLWKANDDGKLDASVKPLLSVLNEIK